MTDDIFGEYAAFSNNEWGHTGHRDSEKRKELWLLNVLINPTNVELARSCRSSEDGNLRGLWIGDDLYWWPAEYATHWDATRWMNTRSLERDTNIEAQLCDDDTINICADTQENVERLMCHPLFVGKFAEDGSLIET